MENQSSERTDFKVATPSQNENPLSPFTSGRKIFKSPALAWGTRRIAPEESLSSESRNEDDEVVRNFAEVSISRHDSLGGPASKLRAHHQTSSHTFHSVNVHDDVSTFQPEPVKRISPPQTEAIVAWTHEREDIGPETLTNSTAIIDFEDKSPDDHLCTTLPCVESTIVSSPSSDGVVDGTSVRFTMRQRKKSYEARVILEGFPPVYLGRFSTRTIAMTAIQRMAQRLESQHSSNKSTRRTSSVAKSPSRLI